VHDTTEELKYSREKKLANREYVASSTYTAIAVPSAKVGAFEVSFL
jgi:hypothetical protein